MRIGWREIDLLTDLSHAPPSSWGVPWTEHSLLSDVSAIASVYCINGLPVRVRPPIQFIQWMLAMNLHRLCFDAISALVMLFGVLFATSSTALADRFVYMDESGQMVDVEARLAGSGRGMHALELADGQIRLVPQASVQKREAAAGPTPISGEQMLQDLETRFTAERFRGLHVKPYVIGLVLSAPLPQANETRVKSVLAQSAEFMSKVEGIFAKFAESVSIELQDPKHPLVLLIFESDRDFEAHAKQVAGALSARRISGFYSYRSNHLMIRMSECRSFEVPLHEAIHQQVFNRGMLQRFAPIPAWFNEGIATAFQGKGARPAGGPDKVNPRYAQRAMAGTNIDWSAVVADDRAFRGNILAADAYTHAWSLHWLLVTRYQEQYQTFVRMLGQKQPLEADNPNQRLREFDAAFGKDVRLLQREFGPALKTAIRRQRVPTKKTIPGFTTSDMNLGYVEMKAVERSALGNALQVQGMLRNMSLIREMAFHVTVETDSGKYAEWHIPRLGVNKVASLRSQFAQKLMKNAPGGNSNAFLVRIRSTNVDSDEAGRWAAGQLPVPTAEPNVPRR